MSYTRRFMAPAVLATGLIAAPLIATAQVPDRGIAPGAPATTDTSRDSDRDFGWIGLLGLVGLAGLMRNPRTDRVTGTRPATATR